MEDKRYLNHIESIRAFAALSVAVFHFTNHYNGESFLILNKDIRSVFSYGAQGVEMFYIISGFIISFSLYKSQYTISNYFRYLSKRFIRIFPPYLTTIVLITLIGIVFTKFLWGGTYDIKFRQIIANSLFIVDSIPHFSLLSEWFTDNKWINPIFPTLKVELQFYILIGLIFPLINRNKLFLVFSSIVLLILGVITKEDYTVLVNIPFFILGIIAFYIFEKGWKTEFVVILAITFLTLAFNYSLEDLIVSIISLMLILGLPTRFKILGFTGKISYSYYLIHGLTGGWFLYFTSKTEFTQNYSPVLIILALLISWIGAYLMYSIIEKPSLTFSKKIKYK